MAEEKPKGRFKLFLLALVFFGPLAIAYALYFFMDDWQPDGSTANGQLLPPTTLSDTPFNDTEEAPRFRARWSIVHIGAGTCDEDCRESLYETRQIRLSMGKDLTRIQRVYVVTDGTPDLPFLNAEHPEMLVVAKGSTAQQEMLAAVGAENNGDLFLVDPVGNLMMRFPADTGMKAIKKDLHHLLKISRIG